MPMPIAVSTTGNGDIGLPRDAPARKPPALWRLLVGVVGMLLVVPLAGWMFLVGTLSASGVFENQSAEGVEAGGALATAAAIGAVAAIVSLVGFVTGVRVLIVAGGLGVSLVAGLLASLWAIKGWRLGRDDTDFLLALVAIVAIGLIAAWSGIERKPVR